MMTDKIDNHVTCLVKWSIAHFGERGRQIYDPQGMCEPCDGKERGCARYKEIRLLEGLGQSRR